MQIDISLFNKHYYIEEQEPVYMYYEVSLRNKIDDSENFISELVNDYYRQDDYVSIDESPITYRIHNHRNDDETFSTTSEESLIEMIKQLNKELLLKELGLKEEEKMDYEDFIEALEKSKLFDDIIVAESKYECTKYDDKRIEEIAGYLNISFEE